MAALIFAVQQVREATRQSDAAVRAGLLALRDETGERLLTLERSMQRWAPSLEAVIAEIRKLDDGNGPRFLPENLRGSKLTLSGGSLELFTFGLPNVEYILRPENFDAIPGDFLKYVFAFLKITDSGALIKFAMGISHSAAHLEGERLMLVAAARATGAVLDEGVVRLVYSHGDSPNNVKFSGAVKHDFVRRCVLAARNLETASRRYFVALEQELRDISSLIAEIDSNLLGQARSRLTRK